MDYTVLAREYMEVLFQMRNRKASKRITDSMHGEHVMLSYLSHHDGIGIPSEISSELGVSTARIAATLNSLETKGLITRRIDEQDRRRILVELTALGKEKESNHAKRIMGVMVESHLVEGRQDLSPDKPLTYGQSVTDACINWDDSVAVMEKLAAAVRARRLAEAAE